MRHRPRVALIGTGMIGAVHLAAARTAAATVLGVLGSSPARSKSVAAAWHLPEGFRDLEAVIAARPDVVHVCTPNRFHAAQAIPLLEAGIGVICEKPLGVDEADAEAMVEAADRTGVVAAVPFVYRYHPLVREIRARRIAGDLGAPLIAHGSYLQDWMLDPTISGWRVDPSSGGASRAFADIGSHWCDLVEWVSGVRFDDVSAVLSTAFPERPGTDGAMSAVTTEDAAAVILRSASGPVGSVMVSQISAGRKNRLWFELDGSLGSAVFDQEQPESVWLGGRKESRVVVRDPTANTPDASRLSVLPAGHPQGYTQCFAAFVADAYEAAQGASPEGLPRFRDGLRAARIAEAVLTSDRTGTWTDIAQPGPA